MATKPQTLAVRKSEVPGVFMVASQSIPGKIYDVDLKGPTCQCDAVVKYGRRSCAHIQAAVAFHDAEAKQMAMELNGYGKPIEEKRPQPAKGHSRLDKMGYVFGEVTSAMQKEVRRGDEEAAVYWGLLLYEASPIYAWKRVVITACEDIGHGDPATVAQVCSLANAWAFVKLGSWQVDPNMIVLAIMLLCRAPKSTEADDLKNLIDQAQKSYLLDEGKVGLRPIPEYALDCHTKAGKADGKTERDWFADRAEMIPTNAYTEKLWQVKPEWRPE